MKFPKTTVAVTALSEAFDAEARDRSDKYYNVKKDAKEDAVNAYLTEMLPAILGGAWKLSDACWSLGRHTDNYHFGPLCSWANVLQDKICRNAAPIQLHDFCGTGSIAMNDEEEAAFRVERRSRAAKEANAVVLRIKRKLDGLQEGVFIPDDPSEFSYGIVSRPIIEQLKQEARAALTDAEATLASQQTLLHEAEATLKRLVDNG